MLCVWGGGGGVVEVLCTCVCVCVSHRGRRDGRDGCVLV